MDNIAGESAVYKRRGQQQPKAFGPQERPKRLLFLVDLRFAASVVVVLLLARSRLHSASMYRFNDQDKRLARLVSLVIMVMESLAESAEMQEKYHYSIVGHSGDDAWIDLGVDFGAPPPTPKERYGVCVRLRLVDGVANRGAAVVRKMLAHSEYCQVCCVCVVALVCMCVLMGVFVAVG